jgi:hypothetical protein
VKNPSPLLAAALFALSAFGHAHAQEIQLYSEFERFDPFGKPVSADRALAPREILSPAMARNGHLSLHVVITGAAGTNYFLYVGSNPPDILQVKFYREYFTPCGEDFCADWLVEQKSPSFGVIPEYRRDVARPAMDKQTTRCYLLDIWAPPNTPPRRVRVEALLKAGAWQVAPLEVRVESAMVPDIRNVPHLVAEDIAPIDAPSSTTAEIQLLRYLSGLAPELPVQTMRVRDVIQRNAAEDVLLARSYKASREAEPLPGLNLLSWWPLLYPQVGAEWYLKVRDFLYRFGS